MTSARCSQHRMPWPSHPASDTLYLTLLSPMPWSPLPLSCMESPAHFHLFPITVEALFCIVPLSLYCTVPSPYCTQKQRSHRWVERVLTTKVLSEEPLHPAKVPLVRYLLYSSRFSFFPLLYSLGFGAACLVFDALALHPCCLKPLALLQIPCSFPPSLPLLLLMNSSVTNSLSLLPLHGCTPPPTSLHSSKPSTPTHLVCLLLRGAID